MQKNTYKLFSVTFCLFFQTTHLVAMINEDESISGHIINSQGTVVGTDHARNSGTIFAEDTGVFSSQETASQAALQCGDRVRGTIPAREEMCVSIKKRDLEKDPGAVRGNNGRIFARGNEGISIRQRDLAEDTGVFSSRGLSTQADLIRTNHAHNEGKLTND